MQNKKVWIATIVFIAVMIAVACIYIIFAPKGVEGTKEITVQVIFGDNTMNTHIITTDAKYLGKALKDEKLIEGEAGQFGIYITAVDGVTADEGKQQWWCLTKGGADVMTGVDETPIADGDQFELTLKTGW